MIVSHHSAASSPMLEYLFFNQIFSDKFTAILNNRNIDFHVEKEPIQNAFSVHVPETIDDDVLDEIDDIYDDISAKDAKMLQENLEDDDKVNTAGIYIQLANNQQTVAKINPDVMNRMLSVISMDEFNDFIEVIVSSVEKPDDSPICKQ